MYSLFAAAALFYLDIPHKNSIELCSVGCSLAAFEDEIFAGVFSGRETDESVRSYKATSEHLAVFTVGVVLLKDLNTALPFYWTDFLLENLLLTNRPQVEAWLCLPSKHQFNCS